MPDVVTADYIYNGQRRKILHLTGISDGTGESAVIKADISTLTFNGGTVPTYTVVDMIDYNIQGYASVRLYWDHTTDDEIAILPAGVGTLDWNAIGGQIDPKTAGGTGDILMTTNGATAGDTYDITLYIRLKA